LRAVSGLLAAAFGLRGQSQYNASGLPLALTSKTGAMKHAIRQAPP
jgi:hypothetical protein